jgi:hypothetical protein
MEKHKHASTAMDDRIHVRLSTDDRSNLKDITARLEAMPGTGTVTPSKALRRALKVAVEALNTAERAV